MKDSPIEIVFDGPPCQESGRFVEVERDGRCVKVGEWVERGKFWYLIIDPVALAENSIQEAFLAGYTEAVIGSDGVSPHSDQAMKTMARWYADKVCSTPKQVEGLSGCGTCRYAVPSKTNPPSLECRVGPPVATAADCLGIHPMVSSSHWCGAYYRKEI